MKSIKLFVSLLLLLLLGMVSCTPVKTTTFESYILVYRSIIGEDIISFKHEENGIIRFYIDDESRTYSYFSSNSEKKEKYLELCKKNNDISFNKKLTYAGYPHWGGEYLAESITSIEIISDNDFDDKHPAGTSLADIVKFNAYTAKPFIDSGYKGDVYQYNGDEVSVDDTKVWTKISKKISELELEDLMLLEVEFMSLEFISMPTLKKEHNLTVKLSFENGQETIVNCQKTW